MDEIEELLATTPQLEAVVYTRSCYDLEGKGRTLAGVAAVAALKELRFLNLGAVQSVDGGLALTGLLGLAATFSLIPETAVGEEGASKLSLFERTEFPVGLRPFSDAGVDNVGVVVRTISGSQKTLGGLVLDTGADNEMCSQAIAPRVAMPIFNFRVYFRQPVCGLVTTSAITGLFAGLRLERLKRLALVRWDVGGEATSHLIAAVNFSQLEELRLVDCVGLQSLFLRLQAGGTKLEKLRSLALTAWEDDIVFVLGKLVSNGRLNDLYLHVLPGNPDGYYNRPEMFPPSPELLSALVGLGGQLEKLEIDALVSREPNKFLVFDADSLGVLMNAFINLRDLAITVDTDKNWVRTSSSSSTMIPPLTTPPAKNPRAPLSA